MVVEGEEVDYQGYLGVIDDLVGICGGGDRAVEVILGVGICCVDDGEGVVCWE